MTRPSTRRSLPVAEAIAIVSKRWIARFTGFALGGEAPGEDHDVTDEVWSEAISAIIAGIFKHPFDRSEYELLWRRAREIPAERQDEWISALTSWRSKNWKHVRERIVSELSGNFSYYFESNHIEERFLAYWPELRGEQRVIGAGLDVLHAKRDRPISVLHVLASLKGTAEDARAALAIILGEQPHLRNEAISRLVHEWAGEVRWGQLFAAIWSSRLETYHPPQQVAELAHLLRQVPLICGPSLDSFALRDMSGPSRAAWRRTLTRLVAEDAALRDAAIEVLLWFADHREDLLCQVTALEMSEPDPRSAIEPFAAHPSHLVALRARSALEIFGGEPDYLEVLLGKEPAHHASNPVLAPSRTWLGDARLEALLRNAFGEAAMSMANEVLATASSGEENLVGKLFERLRGACVAVTRQAAIWARETDRHERLTVALSHRIIGKTEEGADGLRKKRKFSTDVTLIIRARRGADKPFSERATFIQAKRFKRKKRNVDEHYAVDMSQMSDIAIQTKSSYLLAVGPTAQDVVMPIVPAQLMIDRLGTEQKIRHLHPDRVARLGRSLAGWLVDDVIGLWTGDPDVRTVKKAAAGAGDSDTMVVEIKVAFVPIEA
ncbi:hypothetical protein [Roseococcus sp.]|uniref:hypothetical protein n=1 Tax=Roseococcus sp. TaxID=2109646 RepID=UPI003BAD800F